MTAKILRPNPRGFPLMSTAELAAEFGISTAELVRRLVHKGRPEPVMQCGNGNSSSCRKYYYFPHEMRAWWRLRNTESVKEVEK